MNKVFITEKNSVAKELAGHLGLQRHVRGKLPFTGYYILINGDVIAPLSGHLLEQAEPEEYLVGEGKLSSKGKRLWQLSDLPIIPATWKRNPKCEGAKSQYNGVAAEQLGIVVKLMREASIIVNAGDIDREGQLIADEIIEYAGYDPAGTQKPVERVMLVALDTHSLNKALAKPRKNGEDEFVRRRRAGEARARADWLIGMNGTRAFTCRSNSMITVGRVQTPTLGLVVRRDNEIDNFKAINHYIPKITLPDGRELKWTAKDKEAPGLNLDGLLTDKAIADAIVSKIQQNPKGMVTDWRNEQVKEPPKLPFSLAQLQIEMSARFGLTADQVSKIAQSLYQNKAITYIGTDCRYLPMSMHAEAERILSGLSPDLKRRMKDVNVARKYACWNDAKVTAHHAIIPTGTLPTGLTKLEADVYECIALRYIAQFCPEYVYQSSKLTAEFSGEMFVAKWTAPLIPGWKAVDGDIESTEGEAKK